MIGIFDSGSGGLSVLRAIRARVPEVDVVYFADLKHVPYGEKSRETLGALTVLGIQRLLDAEAEYVVSACNSVSVSIMLPMFDVLNLPRAHMVEMVGPTIAHFRDVEDARVLVLATQATIASGAYQQNLRMVGVEVEGLALSGLVQKIEHGASREVLFAHIHTALFPLKGFSYTHIVLGCTHFPLIIDVFQEVCSELGMSAELFDPAYAVAKEVAVRFPKTGKGSTRFLLSAESPVFREWVEKMLPNTSYAVEVV